LAMRFVWLLSCVICCCGHRIQQHQFLDGIDDVLGKLVENNAAAKQVLKKFNQVTDLVEKLRALQNSAKETQSAANNGQTAVVSSAKKLESISGDIKSNQLLPLFDGKWGPEDLAAIGKVDVFLGIVTEILSTTEDLTQLSTLVNSLMQTMVDTITLSESVAELADATGDVNLGAVQPLIARTKELVNIFQREVQKLESVNSDLEPVLSDWEGAPGWRKGAIIALKNKELKRGFENLGVAWQATNEAIIGKAKPLLEDVVLKADQLFANLAAFQILGSPRPGVEASQAPAKPNWRDLGDKVDVPMPWR